MSKLKKETNRRVYKIMYRQYLNKYIGLCPICSPHGGCNFWNKFKGNRNWKRYRKTQWK